MNLKGMTNNIVSKALADASKSPTRWKERAAGKRFENYRKNVGELYLPQMTELIEEGSQRIILDISDVEFMDSSSLGAMVSILKMVGGVGDLVVAGAHGIVADLFKLTRMDKVFRMTSDIKSAEHMMAVA